MFPGVGAEVHYNEAGEPVGWDYPDHGEPEWCDRCGVTHAGACDEEEYDDGADWPDLSLEECVSEGVHGQDCDSDGLNWICSRCGESVGPIDLSILAPHPAPGHAVEEVDPGGYL